VKGTIGVLRKAFTIGSFSPLIDQLLNSRSMKLPDGVFKPGDRIKVAADTGSLIFKSK
jgi:hypothetical protein